VKRTDRAHLLGPFVAAVSLVCSGCCSCPLDDRPEAGGDAAVVVGPDGGAGAPDRIDADGTEAFVGTYQYLTGTRVLTCPTLGGSQTDQLAGTLLIGKGISAPLVMVLASGCALNLDPIENSATLRPNQMCPPQTISLGGEAATEIDTHQGGNFVVIGNSATIAESGSAQLVGSNGATAVCTFTMNGTLNRITK
jgi:hypothetical protein